MANFGHLQIVAVKYIFCVTQYSVYSVTQIILQFFRRANHGENLQNIGFRRLTRTRLVKKHLFRYSASNAEGEGHVDLGNDHRDEEDEENAMEAEANIY